MDKVEIIQLIKTTLTRRGKGIEGDPVRVITQFWDMQGELMFEYDPEKGLINHKIGAGFFGVINP